MPVLHKLDHYHLAIDAIKRIPGLEESAQAVSALALLNAMFDEHHHYVRDHGDDLPEVKDWVWKK